MEGPCSLLDSPLNLLPYQASYTPLCWRNSAVPSGNLSATTCLPLTPKPLCPLYKLWTWSVCQIIPQGVLTPKWQGPFKIILLTLTAAKLEEVTSWVHLSCLKWVPSDTALPSLTDPYQVSLTGPTSLKITQRQPPSTIQEDTE